MTIYSDMNQYKFGPQIKPMLHDVEPVYQSINNILATDPGERLMNPEFGSRLRDLLMQPIDAITTSEIYAAVVQAIKRWEPRVILIHAKSKVVAFPDENRYEVQLYFKIRGIEGQVFDYIGSAVKLGKTAVF